MLVCRFHPLVCLILTATVLATPTPAATAQPPETVPASAQSRLFTAPVRDRAMDLLARTQASPGSVRQALETLVQDPEVDAVTADAVLFDYIRRLRSEPPGSAPPEVLTFLQQHRPRAVQVHPESAAGRMPLFDVAGSARGLENQWRHQGAAHEFLGAGPARKTAMMQSATTGPETNGIRTVLDRLPEPELESLLVRMEENPGLDQWIVETAMAAKREGIVVERMAEANPADASRWIRAAMESLPDAGRMPVLRAGLAHPDPGVRGLAMARITDALSDADTSQRKAWRDELLPRLAAPDTGAAAALQLARVAGEEWLATQHEQAGDPLIRARLALALRLRADRTGSVP